MIDLLDQAVRHVPTEALAKAVRALPDDELAKAVRAADGLRRALVQAMLEQAGGEPEPSAAPEPERRGGLKPGERDALASPQDRVLELVKAAGAEGTTGAAIAKQMGFSGNRARVLLRRLIEAGEVRKEGTTSASRYVAA